MISGKHAAPQKVVARAGRSCTKRARAAFRLASLAFAAALLAGCHKSHPPAPPPAYTAPDIGRSSSKPSAKPHPHQPPHPVIRPEDARGKPASTEIGLSSWYGPPTTNRRTADGAIFNPNELTAAHRTLPLGSIARVTNLETGQSVLVRITDRGPFVKGRILDLSLGAAKEIGVYRMGIAKVKIEAYPDPGADPEGRWCVQIGAFTDLDDAIQLKNDLLRRYSGAKVIDFASQEGHWVRINPTPATHAFALSILNSIHLPDAEPFLVRLN